VYDYRAGKQDWMGAGLPTEGTNAQRPRLVDVVRRDVPTCSLGERLGDVRDRVRAAGWDACVVVSQNRTVLGLLRSKELDADPDLPVEQVMRPGPSTYRPFVSVEEMRRIMTERNMDGSPVTTSDGKLVGLVREQDVTVRPALSEPSGGVADRLVEDRQAERKFVLGGGQWWSDPENTAHSGQLNDVHVQAQFEAALGDERTQLVGTAFGLAVDDQFEAGQQATSPDIADDFVPVRDLLQTMPEDAAKVACAFVEPVTLQHVEDGGADSGRQRVRDVRGEEQEPPVVRRLLEFGAGQHGS